MNFAGAWKFHVSARSLVSGISLLILLALSLSWNLCQHRLIDQQRIADQRAKAAQTKAEAERTVARLKKNAEWAASDARVQQLYQEINNLSRMHEQLLSEPVRSTSTTVDGMVDSSDSP